MAILPNLRVKVGLNVSRVQSALCPEPQGPDCAPTFGCRQRKVTLPGEVGLTAENVDQLT
jgi:hypothetical protein